jgi:anti-sigma B factor antagonist
MDLSGKLTIGEPVMQLRDALRAQLVGGDSKFIVNLAEVSYVDSSGLGELVSSYTTVRNKGGDVKLLKLTAKIKDLLQMTKLLTVFDVYDDEVERDPNGPGSLEAERPASQVAERHKYAHVIIT